MPSLFSRFLGKKKQADQPSLLDGEKYEAVPKTISPVVSTFGEAAHRSKSKEKEQDKGKRSKRPSAGIYDSYRAESVPVLSLSLPEVKDEEKRSQGLGVVFEGVTDGPKTLDDEALGEKRLSPSETLILVQKTSEVLTHRGLETLGVMRPHWFASPRQQEIQLKLIHRFLTTLNSPKDNASPPSPTPQSAFETELRYSRDPHDVASVLRWGLRHLQLEGKSFGSSIAKNWYPTFAERERSESYHPKAFDTILVPLLPASHTDLLRATLDMVSSLAAHSEENGISGNKLSKVLGWWVVSSRNIQGARWPEFYTEWEIAARQFEHLFLAYIRAQESRMPKRLTELVKNYPFEKNRHQEDGIFLPRSRFSTRKADALFLQITVDKSAASARPHPLRIVEEAFRAVPENENIGIYGTLWEEIRKVVSESTQPRDKSKEEGGSEVDASSLNLTAILADESIRLFSLVPAPDDAAASTLSLFTPLPASRSRRSLSVGERSPTSTAANGRPQSFAMESTSHSKSSTFPPSSSQGHDVTPDWQAFSSSGFNSPSGLSLAASLWDNDTEVSQPAPSKKAAGLSKRNSNTSRPRSAEPPLAMRPVVDSPKPARRTYGVPRLVKLDEAFIDFWADSLLDSIARAWPTFVVCQLKPLATLKTPEDRKPIEWLIIERVVDKPALVPVTTSTFAGAVSPLPSPTKSDSLKPNRWAASTLSATRKRFSFLTSPSKHDTAPVGRDHAGRKSEVEARVGEMGEILKEEDEGALNGVGEQVTDKTNGTGKHEEPKKAIEMLQEPPVIRVNGVSKSAEPASTEANRPVLGTANTEDAAKLDPSRHEKFVSTVQERVQPSKHPQAVEKTQPAAETEHPAKPLPEVAKAEASSAYTPTEAPIPPVLVTPVEIVPEAASSREENDLTAAPASAKTLTPAPVEVVPGAHDEMALLNDAVAEHKAASEPAPYPTSALALTSSGSENVEATQQSAEVPSDPVPSAVIEEPSVSRYLSEGTAARHASSKLEQLAVEPSTSEPYVHHATIYIPPADENDIAFVEASASAARENVESSIAASEESAEPPHLPHPTEHKPTVQEPVVVTPEPAVVIEDIVKEDEAYQERTKGDES